MEKKQETIFENENNNNNNEIISSNNKVTKSNKQQKQESTFQEILIKAGKRGLGGGIPGAIAGMFQVFTLMWLRTIMSYQYRYGSNFIQAIKTLYKQGGISRFYRGLGFALIQAPLARFVSTAANDGVETLLANLKYTQDWGVGRTTAIAAIVVGLWRMILMPIDTCKTVLQVDSIEGFTNLMRKVKAGKIGVLYQGSIANAISSILGHYPWFFTYNLLSKNQFFNSIISNQLLKNASIGLIASVVSDTMVNAIRVVKTSKQAMGSKHEQSLNYIQTIQMILAADGWKGLFGRGLQTRILANSLQSIVFTVIWRGLAETYFSTKQQEQQEQNNNSGGTDQSTS